MKEILPFIFIAAFVILQFIANFRKELKKQKQRTPGIPPANIPAQQAGRKKMANPADKPMLVQEHKPDENTYESAYSREYQEPKYERMKAPELIKENSRGYKPVFAPTYKEPYTDETLKNRRIHEPHRAHKQIKVEGIEEETFHFDLHDAVIKQAILNRPEH